MVTNRRVTSFLRARKNRYYQTESIDELDENEAEAWSVDNIIENQIDNEKLLSATLRRMKNCLSNQGYNIFIQLYVLGKTPEETAQKMNITKNAIYIWRTRIRQKLLNISNLINW